MSWSLGELPLNQEIENNMNSLIWKGRISFILAIIGEISWPDPQKYKIKISKEMKNFIERLLDKNPECRLGAKGVRS